MKTDREKVSLSKAAAWEEGFRRRESIKKRILEKMENNGIVFVHLAPASN